MKTIPHPMDVVLQKIVPTIMVHARTPFEPLAENGHRFLAAHDGLWMEVKTDWLYLCYPIAQQRVIPLPYGSLSPNIDIRYGPPPITLLQRFQLDAKEACPGQAHAWITWSQLGGFRYYRLDRKRTENGKQDVSWPELQEGENLVFNLHSHGSAPPFFSEEDTQVNAHGSYFSGVFGHCDAETQESRYCLHVKGLQIDMDDVFSMLTS